MASTMPGEDSHERRSGPQSAQSLPTLPTEVIRQIAHEVAGPQLKAAHYTDIFPALWAEPFPPIDPAFKAMLYLSKSIYALLEPDLYWMVSLVPHSDKCEQYADALRDRPERCDFVHYVQILDRNYFPRSEAQVAARGNGPDSNILHVLQTCRPTILQLDLSVHIGAVLEAVCTDRIERLSLGETQSPFEVVMCPDWLHLLHRTAPTLVELALNDPLYDSRDYEPQNVPTLPLLRKLSWGVTNVGWRRIEKTRVQDNPSLYTALACAHVKEFEHLEIDLDESFACVDALKHECIAIHEGTKGRAEPRPCLSVLRVHVTEALKEGEGLYRLSMKLSCLSKFCKIEEIQLVGQPNSNAMWSALTALEVSLNRIEESNWLPSLRRINMVHANLEPHSSTENPTAAECKRSRWFVDFVKTVQARNNIELVLPRELVNYGDLADREPAEGNDDSAIDESDIDEPDIGESDIEDSGVDATGSDESDIGD